MKVKTYVDRIEALSKKYSGNLYTYSALAVVRDCAREVGDHVELEKYGRAGRTLFTVGEACRTLESVVSSQEWQKICSPLTINDFIEGVFEEHGKSDYY